MQHNWLSAFIFQCHDIPQKTTVFPHLIVNHILIQEDCPYNLPLLSRPGQHWAVPSGISGRRVGLHVLSFILDSPFNDAFNDVSPSEILYFSSFNSIQSKDLNCKVFSHSTTKNHFWISLNDSHMPHMVGWKMPPTMSMSYSQILWMLLYMRKRDFADVIKDPIIKRLSW